MEPVLVAAKNRRTLRRAVRLPCEVVRARDFKLVGRRAVDLSTEGMQILAESDVLTGEEVVLSFRLPRCATWIDAEATVVRVSHGRRAEDRPFRTLGLAFRPLRWAARSDLAKALSGLPRLDPRRDLRVDWAATVAKIAR